MAVFKHNRVTGEERFKKIERNRRREAFIRNANWYRKEISVIRHKSPAVGHNDCDLSAISCLVYICSSRDNGVA